MNKQVALGYFAAYLAADETWWRGHIASDFRRHNLGLLFEVIGAEGTEWLAEALTPGIPDLELPVEDMIAEGEMVLVRTHVRDTHGGHLMSIAATGRKVDIGALDPFQFRDGRLTEHWAPLDNPGLLRQLGVTTL